MVFDHVGIAVSDLAASERFYRTVLSGLGVEPATRRAMTDDGNRHISRERLAASTSNMPSLAAPRRAATPPLEGWVSLR